MLNGLDMNVKRGSSTSNGLAIDVRGRDMVRFFARDPVFWPKILIPDPKSSLDFDP